MSGPLKKANPQPTRIPERYLDIPSQRLYIVSLGILCQAVKLFDFLHWLVSSEEGFTKCRKWLLVDLTYCVLLNFLRIPRLSYSKANVLLQILSLWLLDGLIFGGISINIPIALGSPRSSSAGFSYGDIPSTPEPFSITNILAPFTFGLISSTLGTKDGHLIGQHTIRMSPVSTAQLNPQGSPFCLASSSGHVFVPIILNNTRLSGLNYSIAPLNGHYDRTSQKLEYVYLTAKDLKAIEHDRNEVTQVIRSSINDRDPEDFDDYDDDDDHETSESPNSRSALQKSQSLIHIRLSKPGIVRLEHVLDTSHTEARITPSKAVLVPCPQMEFADAAVESVRCAGQDPDQQLLIHVSGVPPLSLKWLKAVNGSREEFLVEGIEGDHFYKHVEGTQNPVEADSIVNVRINPPQELKIPLKVSLDQPGAYLYALEEISDAIGNVVRVGNGVVVGNDAAQTKTTRSFVLLRKPSVSFENCDIDHPTALLIGSEASMTIEMHDADGFDAPWDVIVNYQPPSNTDQGIKGGKQIKPWKKTLKSQADRKQISLHAISPGDYLITGVKGKYCTGTVLAPDICRVAEKPLPSAEIKWKKIHECSGDTGVSATLVLRGTPPFQVYYRMQRDDEPPREMSKTFATSRGELTLQPDRSGHYVFTFISLSDANYRKVELQGPSIDQVIHPLASADFIDGNPKGRQRRFINSCGGEFINVDIELRGTGPWNLEFQVIGSESSETVMASKIETSRKTIQIPLPQSVKKNGGTFEIDLISVEDAYKCRRPISVPGVVANVKRVKPTVRFYGNKQERSLTITEGNHASLPLRLTGDGPWHVKYSKDASNQIMTAILKNANDFLRVTEQGTYEIVDVADSQCPGLVVTDASTYEVNWVPRPSARLSQETQATYVSQNGSHILQPICEGLNDHVDLDLTGRPPFQIMYNIAQDSGAGGTTVFDQPTFNSIQPRTRFQLQTSSPGRMYYEVKQVGDAAYPSSIHRGAVIPRDERLLFEQQVMMRPSALFRNRNRMHYCLNDVFTPLDTTPSDGIIYLQGTPPFKLTLSIKNFATSQVAALTVDVSDHAWRINLPSHSFRSIGPHLVKIESIVDTSNCAQQVLDPLNSSIWVDVAESAAIVPMERNEDVCVGEPLHFQLEGIPPWMIGYLINGKSYSQEAKSSPFSLLQKQVGEFKITSIVHQHQMCKATITDLKYVVHDLPSAQVGHGQKVYTDIHEGDQAEIIFTLIGEPPFTFTYQRTEVSPKKGGKSGKVLETHTVSRVFTNEYSIFSALEGTWTVTSISDRYCRYPPSQTESDAKHR